MTLAHVDVVCSWQVAEEVDMSVVDMHIWLHGEVIIRLRHG